MVVLPEGRFCSVSNDAAGWAELVARLHPLAVSAIGLEPSGGYKRGIIRALLAARLSVRRTSIRPRSRRPVASATSRLSITATTSSCSTRSPSRLRNSTTVPSSLTATRAIRSPLGSPSRENRPATGFGQAESLVQTTAAEVEAAGRAVRMRRGSASARLCALASNSWGTERK